MLEVRYNINTKKITGWWGNRHGNHEAKLKNRPDEAIALLDTPIPDKPLEAWLYDETTQSLVPNPDFIEPYDPASDEARLTEIIANSPEVITMPEMWEAIRILARLRGI
ncbi:hypothetical protein ES703_56965 [subsurface metagenome]